LPSHIQAVEYGTAEEELRWRWERGERWCQEDWVYAMLGCLFFRDDLQEDETRSVGESCLVLLVQNTKPIRRRLQHLR
jgi:hypothetical protein